MKRWTVISLIVLASVLLSACTGSVGTSTWPGLAADKDRAYLADGAYIYAVRLSDGVQAWQYPTDKAGAALFYSNPVLTSDGQLLVGSSGHDYALYSLDPATGNPKWAAPFVADDHWVAPPLVVGDIIYAPNNNGTLYAINLATGQLMWSAPTSSAESLWGTPTTDGKLIFVSSLDHFVYALDPNAHKVVWKRDLGGSIPGSPLVAPDGSNVFVGSFASKMYALEASTGAVRWTAALKNWVWNAPALVGDTLYTADTSGNVYSLATPTGKNSWPEVKPDGAITAGPLALPDGVVVATEAGSIYGYKPDGSTLWPPITIEKAKIYTTPVLAGDRILVAPMGAQYLLYAVNAKDGSLLPWHFSNK